jgi:hypothetical protein
VASHESKRRTRARDASERTEAVIADVQAGAFRLLPDPPRRAELLALLGVQARSGSVRAVELLLRMEGDVGDKQSDPLTELDELAARRLGTEHPGEAS